MTVCSAELLHLRRSADAFLSTRARAGCDKRLCLYGQVGTAKRSQVNAARQAINAQTVDLQQHPQAKT
jgi:hypothetical protein